MQKLININKKYCDLTIPWISRFREGNYIAIIPEFSEDLVYVKFINGFIQSGSIRSKHKNKSIININMLNRPLTFIRF